MFIRARGLEALCYFCGAQGPSAWAYPLEGCSERALLPSAWLRPELLWPRPPEVAHIVEEPGGLEQLAEIDTPTEEYYDVLRKDMAEKHPRASSSVLDHLLSLEAFLDKSIAAGFSYGCDKAEVLVTHGKLLGHMVTREGSQPDGERVQAVMDFAPL